METTKKLTEQELNVTKETIVTVESLLSLVEPKHCKFFF